MHAFLMQDWVTIRGSSGINVTQGEDGWLDLSGYQDVVFWVDCREFTGTIGSTPQIGFQTSPTKDEALFTIVGNAGFTFFNTTTILVRQALMNSATPGPPLARYVRWQIAAANATWDATFRILAVANSVGG